MNNALQNKRILIIGGSSGIGLAVTNRQWKEQNPDEGIITWMP